MVGLIGLASLTPLVGCGDSAAPPATTAAAPRPVVTAGGLVDESYRGPFMASATVLERDDGGPQLCVGGIGLSDPPACGGPLIANWDWDAVPHQTRAGVRYGSYLVEGSFDGTTFTLTKPAEPFTGQEIPGTDDEVDFTPQCPEPEGGWRPADLSSSNEARLREALQLAQTLDGYAGAWVDEGAPVDVEAQVDDPADTLLNVRTTSVVDAAEQALREVWGGALCVSEAERTYAQLKQVQTELMEMSGALGIGIDVPAGQVHLRVIVATTQEQSRLDESYGIGVVRLQGELLPRHQGGGSRPVLRESDH